MPRPPESTSPVEKTGLHPRNRHRGRYDFADLARAWPELGQHVIRTPYGGESIDFANPLSVRALNQALLSRFYGIRDWDLPAGYLCPPIPGRADYLHHVADLLADVNGGRTPTGPSVRVLDIGVGANLVYPIIGHAEYGWSFLGSDIDAGALASARRIARANPALARNLELRLQPVPGDILHGVLKPGERVALTICNPPFHASAAEADASSRRKTHNLGHAPGRNFGGQDSELWCEGGELGFLRRMIRESVEFAPQCPWFTSLVSKVDHLNPIFAELDRAGARDVRERRMAQGQKTSRIVAWTF